MTDVRQGEKAEEGTERSQAGGTTLNAPNLVQENLDGPISGLHDFLPQCPNPACRLSDRGLEDPAPSPCLTWLVVMSPLTMIISGFWGAREGKIERSGGPGAPNVFKY